MGAMKIEIKQKNNGFIGGSTGLGVCIALKGLEHVFPFKKNAPHWRISLINGSSGIGVMVIQVNFVAANRDPTALHNNWTLRIQTTR